MSALQSSDIALDTTVPELFRRNATTFPDAPALTCGGTGKERTWTWSQALTESTTLAAGLSALGLGRGQTVLIMMANRAEHWLADTAATSLGAVPSTVYATSSPDQVLYIAQHSRARVAVLEGAEQLDRWSAALRELPSLNHVVVLDEAAMPRHDKRFISWQDLQQLGKQTLAEDRDLVERARKSLSPGQPIAVLYTSGTTGDPKGVVLTHRNVIHGAAAAHEIVAPPQGSSVICYLPLAHIAERMLTIYAAIYGAAHVHFCPDPSAVVSKLAEVRPRSFFGVPRVWEKLSAFLQTIPPDQRSTPEAVEELRKNLGLDQAIWPASGAAPISREVLETLASAGIAVNELWGMTETSGAATSNRPGNNRLGTVGTPLSGTEIRTSEDGEILVRGPLVCAGYLQADGAISPATDGGGWLHTGDLGTIDADGFLTITGRKKELIITSGGKNIPPSAVENALNAHPLIGHALAYGDRRPYIVALLALDEEAAPAWARARGIEFTNVEELAGHPTIQSEVDNAVSAANARLNRAQQIKRYRLLSRPWGVAGGELTPTLKLKRGVIQDRYRQVLDELYT